MAVSKLGTSTLGGAAAGAQLGATLGTVGGPLGITSGAVLGGLYGAGAGLAYGALQKEDAVIKAQRKQKRLEKIRGKKRVGLREGREVRKDLEGDIAALRSDPRAAAYLDNVAKANQPIVGLDAPIVVQGGSDPRAGQETLSTGGGTVTAGTADEEIFRDAVRKGVEAKLSENIALDKMAASTAAGATAAETLTGAEAASKQEAMQDAATMQQLGAAGSQAIQTERQVKARKDLESTITEYKDLEWDSNNQGYATTGQAMPMSEDQYITAGFSDDQKLMHMSQLKHQAQQRQMASRLYSSLAGLTDPMASGRYGYSPYAGMGGTSLGMTTQAQAPIPGAK